MPVTVCFAKRVCEEFLGKESNVSFSNSFDFITNRKIPYCLYSLILTAGQILLKLRVQAENKLISCPVEIVCFSVCVTILFIRLSIQTKLCRWTSFESP